jgi:hypothetical protein
VRNEDSRILNVPGNVSVTPLPTTAVVDQYLADFQNLIGLGLGPLFFGMLSDWLQPVYGADSVRYVLYGAAVLGLVPAFFFWRCSLHLDRELDQKDITPAPAPAVPASPIRS